MLRIGCHLSTSKGYVALAQEARALKANTLQFFARNPRGGAARAVSAEETEAFRVVTGKSIISDMVAHAPYTVNPCSSKEEVRQFAFEAITGDLERLAELGVTLYNLHPGSHTGLGAEEGITLTAATLNSALDAKKDVKVRVLLETMAGKGTEIGRTFEQLAEILVRIEDQSRIGVCFDTCHVHDAGYDLSNDLDGVLNTFDSVIGLERLYAVHLNDSMNAVGARKDRHEKIGEGEIGLDAFEKLVRHPALSDLPFILETPNDAEGYAREIRILRKAAAGNKNGRVHDPRPAAGLSEK